MKNQTVNDIMTRRSIRSFLQKTIPAADLKTVALSAVYAPSARNLQTWKFAVVQDKTMIKKLAAAVAKRLGRDSGYCFYAPDAIILACNDRQSPYAREDCACALENIFLTAHSLGIGSVWINQFLGICDDPDIRSLLTVLGVPSTHDVFGAAALGYAASPALPANKDESAVVFYLPDAGLQTL